MAEPFIAFVHPDDRERTLARAQAMYEQGDDTVSFENRYRRRDGTYAWLQWFAVATEDGNLLSYARDVTERKEAQLRDFERIRMLEMSEQLAGISQWRYDLIDDKLFWTSGVFEIYGRKKEAGEPEVEESDAAYHPEDRDMVNAAVEAAIERQEGFHFEARIVRPDGEVREVESQGVPEVNYAGEVVALIGIFRDITDSRRMEEALRRSERMVSIGTMAAGVAHEINNPLSYLLGNLQLINEELDRLRPQLPPESVAEIDSMLSDSVAGGKRVRKIVNGMRAFSRVGTTQASVVDVSSVIKAAVAMAEHEVRLRAELEVDVEDVGSVFIDETQLVQVIVNLLVNAAQALPEGEARKHTIRLEVRQEEGDVVIRVSDTGPGIPRDLRGRVFDPFFTTKPVGSGTGLGLAISFSIITHHGGRLELEETTSGASFRISLPVIAGHGGPAGDADEIEARTPSRRARALLIDDEPQLLSMLERALKSTFDLVQVGSGRAALELLENDRAFDLIVCDLMMPEVSGVEVLRWLATTSPELLERSVVATGGDPSDETLKELEAMGLDTIRKPFDIPELRRDLVRRALGDDVDPRQ